MALRCSPSPRPPRLLDAARPVLALALTIGSAVVATLVYGWDAAPNIYVGFAAFSVALLALTGWETRRAGRRLLRALALRRQGRQTLLNPAACDDSAAATALLAANSAWAGDLGAISFEKILALEQRLGRRLPRKWIAAEGVPWPELRMDSLRLYRRPGFARLITLLPFAGLALLVAFVISAMLHALAAAAASWLGTSTVVIWIAIPLIFTPMLTMAGVRLFDRMTSGVSRSEGDLIVRNWFFRRRVPLNRVFAIVTLAPSSSRILTGELGQHPDDDSDQQRVLVMWLLPGGQSCVALEV